MHQFLSRKEAEYNEARIRSALAKGPASIEAMIDNFSRISTMIRPVKTLDDLRAEERAFVAEMEGAFHHVPVGHSFVVRTATCGWTGALPNAIFDGTIKNPTGTDRWEALFQMERERKALESVGGRYSGRNACQRCLALAPSDFLCAGEGPDYE